MASYRDFFTNMTSLMRDLAVGTEDPETVGGIATVFRNVEQAVFPGSSDDYGAPADSWQEWGNLACTLTRKSGGQDSKLAGSVFPTQIFEVQVSAVELFDGTRLLPTDRLRIGDTMFAIIDNAIQETGETGLILLVKPIVPDSTVYG